MPRGRIYVRKAKNRVQFYLRLDGREVYLRKENKNEIRRYLQKAYDEKIIRLIGGEVAGLTTLLDRQSNTIHAIKRAYASHPEEVKGYIIPVDISDEEYAAQWQKQPYEAKKQDEGHQAFMTERGESVRSKSELNIANMLHGMGIPYRYECPLVLRSGVTIYPDFTVLDVTNRRIVYWEHRGMMDDKDYAEHAVLRIKSYARNNIHIGRDLIITEETQKHPLGTQEIKGLIQAYFG